ncbi:telomerase RNA component interacting RNase isoform X1 [Cynoglossus semilaevis]|uniref:telomerase RNA component interacting RNase isoform X1 n=1 Tax=Cynoglossus semilaevis TaxID=244447 RepID=UPI000D630301|nr:telomerase RNA component interacting RNase isoform X1 [Cynoglossus semilaevis]
MDPHGPTPATSNDGSSGGSSPASPSGSPAPAVGAAMVTGGNVFANDGSFMEMFKKMEEEKKKKKEKEQTVSFIGSQPTRTPVTVSVFYPLTQVGKRRGGVFLKTGVVVKKQKQDTEATPGKSDAWSKYMAEVKKYKAHQCSDDDKTRPLVK